MKGLVHVVVIYFCTSVCTRAAIICFVDPPVGPSSEEDELEELIHGGELSRAIGWAIQLGQRLSSCRQDILDIKEKLRGVMSGRKIQNWGMMLFFVKQVCKCTCTYTK